MEIQEKRLSLIKYLLNEQPQYRTMMIPRSDDEQERLLRSLMNIRQPHPVDAYFLNMQDEYLKERIEEKGITDFGEIEEMSDGIYLWQGDITTLKCDAIVNAANSGMTGCYYPCHNCIDNAIHTYAGIQLRLECAEIMEKQGYAEPAGKAKITKAYNLPCKYILHTVGPIVMDAVTKTDETLLSSCYRSCLELARDNEIKSVAFCCISTGEFHFPNERAAEIAIQTVLEYRGEIEVIFNVFKDTDYRIYRRLLVKD